MKRVGLFVDVSNIFYSLARRFDGGKLNYKKYVNYLQDFGKLDIMRAYGANLEGEADRFIKLLKDLGFETIFKAPKVYETAGQIKRKADHDVTITVDIIRNLNNIDIIILGSADGDMVPVIEYAKEQDKKVIVFACTISRDVRNIVDEYMEIPESYLETRNNDTHKTG